jgi:hypothetical protein
MRCGALRLLLRFAFVWGLAKAQDVQEERGEYYWAIRRVLLITRIISVFHYSDVIACLTKSPFCFVFSIFRIKATVPPRPFTAQSPAVPSSSIPVRTTPTMRWP